MHLRNYLYGSEKGKSAYSHRTPLALLQTLVCWLRFLF